MLTQRSERLALPIPITYRIAGDDHWIHSRVMNISDTGVLFGPTGVGPGTSLEVIFAAPVNIGTMASGKLVCAAEVVRTTDEGAAAARFDECRFLLDA
jgi:hypothetical protein